MFKFYSDDTLFVSLLPGSTAQSAAPNHVLWSAEMTHPQLHSGVVGSQQAIAKMNNDGGWQQRVLVCGAWTGTCFHESGCASGALAARNGLFTVFILVT